MTITVAPFTVNLTDNRVISPFAPYKEEEALPAVFWGVYMQSELISYTSSRKQAEDTKLWMERWLSSDN